MKCNVLAACGLVMTVALSGHAAAQNFPAKAVSMVIPFPAGGAVDIVCRTVALRLGEIWKQPVTALNRPGAGGNIGVESVVRSPADGYTVLCASTALSINPGLYAKLPFDPEKDLLPVIQAVDSTNVLSLHPSVAAGSVKELIALAKTKSLSYGSSGIGGTGHLAGELFNVMAGTKLVHVPYKGGGPAIIDLVAGQVQVVFATGASAVPQMKSGRIKGIAVTTLKRSALLPDIPTIAEGGLKDFDANNWYGIMVPAKTPRNVINRLNAETAKVLSMPDVKTFLFNQGLDAAPGTPEAFGAYIKAERIKWAKVIKAAGAKAE